MASLIIQTFIAKTKMHFFMEEGNGMKQDDIILYFDVPKLVVFN
jgi:hypothetical protein